LKRLALAALMLTATVRVAAQSPRLPAYPPTARGSVVDDVSGVRVADAYRWLENIPSPETQSWVAAQNAVTDAYLAQLPNRRSIQSQLTWAWAYQKVSAPFGGGERLFHFENGGLENQPALYVQERRELPRILIDPNAFSSEGLIAVVDQAASPGGRYLAYAVATQGSAWRLVRIRDVRSGQDIGDELTGIKDGPLSWTKDERGFFYTRITPPRATTPANPLAPDGRQQIFYHRVGRPQSDDRLMYENSAHPEWILGADLSEDGEYLVLSARAGTELANRLFLIDLDNPKRPDLGAPLVTLFDAGDAIYEFVANSGPVFFIRTTKKAPRARLVAVDINTPDESHWTPIVRETYDPLVGAQRVDDRIVVHRLHDAHSVLELYALDGGGRGTIPLPGVGTVTRINGRSDYRELYFEYTSFLQQPVVYRYDLESKSTVAYRRMPPDSALASYETKQLYFASADGTRIPMFVTARRGLTLDGSHPTLLTGVGSFGVSATPIFSPAIATWLELGGIYAVANVRGGGEDGRAWHEAAMRANKRVAVDDFTAAAEFLITQHYTRAASLGVIGRGAGGMLVGAALTARPELFGGAVIDAGLLDMARFDQFTIGPNWIPEFGSPENSSDLKTLLAYSPLQNIRAGSHYPATLVTVGDHDEVFTPAPSYKFVAALQAAQGAAAPVLLRVEHNVGFGPGTPTAKQLARETDQLTFLANALHLGR
jgi:prolyl oligopeptidase